MVSRHSRPVRAAFFSLGLFAGPCGAVHAGDALPRYALTASVALGSPDHWDYLFFDASAKRVYVSHGDEMDPSWMEKPERWPARLRGFLAATAC